MRINRAKRDRWIRGVCGGIAHAYAIYVLLGAILPESEEY